MDKFDDYLASTAKWLGIIFVWTVIIVILLDSIK